ncbi:MAG: glycosyltransferase family 39 protein [Candidatus Eisenbacteria sp.]|nr:glycosyltransferase family 39 protein [Candidatus Eisenbacteria bacterium]
MAGFLRLISLGREGLWCDEAYTALMVQLPLPEMIQSLMRYDDAPPLFYMLQKLVVSCGGCSETALRLVPALSGIVAVFLLLIRWCKEERGQYCWAAIFLATTTYGVFYARQARSYGLLILLALLFILSAKDLLLKNRRGWAGPLLAMTGMLLCMTHHLGVVLILTSFLLWPLRKTRGLTLASWALWHLLPLAVWATWWAVSSSQLQTHAELNTWMGEFWKGHHLAAAPALSLGAFLPAVLPASLRAVALASPGEISPFWHILSALLGAGCLLAALVPRLPSALPRESGREIAIEATFLVIPLVALAAVSLILTPVYVLGRTDAIAYPAFVLLIGRGLTKLPRAAATGILIFWIALSIASLSPSYGLGSPGRAKGADRHLAEVLGKEGLAPDDWVIHSSLTAPSVEYYLRRNGVHHQSAWFPEVAGTNPAGVVPTPLDSLQTYLDQARALRQVLESALPQDGSVWILGLRGQRTQPGKDHRTDITRPLSAQEIGYPMSLLVYTLVGMEPITPVLSYRQDWVGGERILLRIPRNRWVPED